MINVRTGLSHYHQLSVVTYYRGITDYHSNKVVKITSVRKNLYGDLNFLKFNCLKTVTVPLQKNPQVQLSLWEISLNLTINNDNIRGLYYLD